MLSLNEVKPGKVVVFSGEPYLIIKTDHHKAARGGAVLKTKSRNLANGSVLERTFQGNDKLEEAETSIKTVNFMYRDDTNAFFMDNSTYEQFELAIKDLDGKEEFLKDGTDVDMLYFGEKPISLKLPIKMNFKVVSAPPGVKGNSAGNVTKQVEIETGATLNVPMFINEGDIIRVNTDTGEYQERA